MEKSQATFVVVDYVVFFSMLLLSTCIGLFYAVKDRNKRSTENYFLGGRTMSPFPVAFSLSVSFLSAVTVLGTPAEIYLHGTMYFWILFGCLIAFIVTATVFLPVYYNNSLSSINQYLGLRFHPHVRLLASVFYLVQTSLYTGLVIFAPASALSALTGLNLWTIAITTGLVCIVYSCLGGLKAVLWSDTLQMFIMVVGFLSVIIKASNLVGGFEVLWERANSGGRLQLWNFDIDPRIRHTTWSVAIGSCFFNLALYSANQAQVQRYLSCRSLEGAKIAIALNYFGMFLLLGLAILSGVVMYGYYHGCDPLSQQTGVKRSDQLMPYMVLEMFQEVPGMAGLFTAAIFSGSLSTVSTSITAMASVTLQDLLKPVANQSEEKLTRISRILICFYGCLCLIFAYVMSQLGGILQVAISILSLAGAPLLVAFTMGVVLPFANTTGTLSGMIGATFGTVLLFCGKIFHPAHQRFAQNLPLSNADCRRLNDTSTLSTFTTTQLQDTEPFLNSTTYDFKSATERHLAEDFFAMSYMYMTAFGFTVGITIGIVVSVLTGGWKSRDLVPPHLICSILRKNKPFLEKVSLSKSDDDDAEAKLTEETATSSSAKSLSK